MSDPPLSDIDFKNKMAWVWTTFNVKMIPGFRRCNSRGRTDCNLQLLDRRTVPFHLVDFEYHK